MVKETQDMHRKQTIQKGKAAPLLEWQTDEDENEWQARQSSSNAGEPGSRAAQKPRWLMRHWWLVFVALALLAGVVGWTWYEAQKGVAQIEAELRESVEVDLWTAAQDSQETYTLHPLTSTVQMLALTGETAIVRLVMQPRPNQPALRQARVYQRTEFGWQRIAPTRVLWGAPRRLQTKYFDFHYYAQDEEAVTAAAATVDGFYSSLSTHFQSSMLAHVRIQVEIDPTKTYGSIARRPNPEAPLVVASPATYLAPVELSEGDLLAQSVVLSLLSESAAQAVEARWQPLLDGLFLWQLWEADLPLTVWREPLVKWILAALENPQADTSSGEPAFSMELCALYQLWMMSPLDIKIPVFCDKTIWAKEYLTLWKVSYQPPMTLTQLVPGVVRPRDYTLPLEYTFSPVHPGSAVVLATVIDYAATTYGREGLALLLSSLHDHQGWATLAPAVFGVSAAGFEAGWRSYLVERYNVSLNQ
jgi:hypothetical protein